MDDKERLIWFDRFSLKDGEQTKTESRFAICSCYLVAHEGQLDSHWQDEHGKQFLSDKEES